MMHLASSVTALYFCLSLIVLSILQKIFIQAYKRATDANPEQEIAWEGLSKFYDKHADNKTYTDHHITVLNTLLQLLKVSKQFKGMSNDWS